MKLRDNFLFKIFAAFLSGILLSLGFPGYIFPNFAVPYVVVIALVPLLLVLFTLKGRRYILKGIFYIWIFGLTFQLTSFFWISQPIIYFSGLSENIGYFIFIVISFLTSFYFVILLSPILFYIWFRHSQKSAKIHIFVLAILITALEILIPRFFQWSIGQIFNQIYFWQINSLFGFNTGTLVIVLTNLSITYAILRFNHKRILAKMILLNVTLWTCVMFYGFMRIHILNPKIDASPKIRVAFIQPNFTFQELASKRIHAHNAHTLSLETVLQMSQNVVAQSIAYDNKRPDLLVWPESVAPDGIFVNEMLQGIVIHAANELQVPILVQDSIRKKTHPTDKNFSIWSISRIISGKGFGKHEFAKWVPIPFGEALPLEEVFPELGNLYRKVIQNSSKVESGWSFQALSVDDKFYVAPLICFDSIYQRLPYLQAKYGGADLFINQANFMWMVQSNAGLEFSYLDKARAIENARSMIMVSNTGPTIAFDPLGRVIWGPSKIMSSDLGFFDVPLYENKTLFSYVYNWPIFILALWAVYKLARLLRSRSS